MNVWEAAAGLVARYLADRTRVDALLENVSPEATPIERRRCLHLVYGAVRHLRLLESALQCHLRRPPRPRLQAALLLGAYELLEHPENAAVIVHHAVDRTRRWTSPVEARLVNAVLRRVAADLPALLEKPAVSADELGVRFSHPTWLVERWLELWGADATRQLLAWDQEPAVVHARVSGLATVPAGFQPTTWKGFFRLDRPDWSEVEQLLSRGAIYLQDPATAFAPDLLAPQPGETILDLCAAPGGKTIQLAEAAGPHGCVVAVDLPGSRLNRLRDNLARRPTLPVSVFGADATTLSPEALAAAGLPKRYDAVLLDVPCSNTGVLRHRADVKWRLQPADLHALPDLQLRLLRNAARFVRSGGRIVYSTCSLEPEENEQVVQRFLNETRAGTPPVQENVIRTDHDFLHAFSPLASRSSRPWETGCDGAGAFLLRREA